MLFPGGSPQDVPLILHVPLSDITCMHVEPTPNDSKTANT